MELPGVRVDWHNCHRVQRHHVGEACDVCVRGEGEFEEMWVGSLAVLEQRTAAADSVRHTRELSKGRAEEHTDEVPSVSRLVLPSATWDGRTE